MNYFFEDFTLGNYATLIKVAKANYEFISYEDAYSSSEMNGKVLWRHDVDFSIGQSYLLAEIENKEGIQATYFIHLHNEFYSIWETDTLRLLYRIIEKGGKVGLHFDFGFYYGVYGKNMNKEDFEEAAHEEKRALLKLTSMSDQDKIPISFHNPELCNVMDIQSDYYGGMVNAYSAKIKEKFKYCSDSNGYWRYERLANVLQNKDVKSLHVLTHPGWWQLKEMAPADRIKKIISERAERVYNNYCEMLVKGKRLNVE